MGEGNENEGGKIVNLLDNISPQNSRFLKFLEHTQTSAIFPMPQGEMREISEISKLILGSKNKINKSLFVHSVKELQEVELHKLVEVLVNTESEEINNNLEYITAIMYCIFKVKSKTKKEN